MYKNYLTKKKFATALAFLVTPLFIGLFYGLIFESPTLAGICFFFIAFISIIIGLFLMFGEVEIK